MWEEMVQHIVVVAREQPGERQTRGVRVRVPSDSLGRTPEVGLSLIKARDVLRHEPGATGPCSASENPSPSAEASPGVFQRSSA